MDPDNHKRILVTGAAGFIGFHLSRKLMGLGYDVTGIDNVNDYYDVRLKRDRLSVLQGTPGKFSFSELDLTNKVSLENLFANSSFDYVVNLAAQAGVRYSLINPDAYLESNLRGFLNILECCRHHKPKHLLYASSSSVYGANKKMPFTIHDNTDHPLTLYAASKKSNELMAHSYSSLFGIPTTGLRFFTVYGPFGRPDMAMFIFTKAILEDQPIDLFNDGKMTRDFTYVDDIVETIVRLVPHIAKPNPDWDAMNPEPSTSLAPYRIYNVGNNRPVDLPYFVSLIEEKLGKKATMKYAPIQSGDVPKTFAGVDELSELGFRPSTPVEVGVGKFVDWYLNYYKIRK